MGSRNCESLSHVPTLSEDVNSKCTQMWASAPGCRVRGQGRWGVGVLPGVYLQVPAHLNWAALLTEPRGSDLYCEPPLGEAPEVRFDPHPLSLRRPRRELGAEEWGEGGAPVCSSNSLHLSRCCWDLPAALSHLLHPATRDGLAGFSADVAVKRSKCWKSGWKHTKGKPGSKTFSLPRLVT